MIKLETERLTIREHRIEDLDGYHAWISDPAVMRYVNGFGQTHTIEESRGSLVETMESYAETPRTKFFLAVALTSTAEYIGSVGSTVERLETNGGIMGIGYFLNKNHWSNGCTTEATCAWIDYAFRSLGVHKIRANCDSANTPSVRVMQKCGMIKEAELLQHRYKDGTWRDELQYAVIRSDWMVK
jgi:[ribosomal protein S5]-alanine N-acetyltransferase